LIFLIFAVQSFPKFSNFLPKKIAKPRQKIPAKVRCTTPTYKKFAKKLQILGLEKIEF